MDKNMMLEKLMELDFISLDLGLYLNTHPTNKEAIKAYNEAVVAGSTLREKYENQFGPLCSFRSYAYNEDNWQWINMS